MIMLLSNDMYTLAESGPFFRQQTLICSQGSQRLLMEEEEIFLV